MSDASRSFLRILLLETPSASNPPPRTRMFECPDYHNVEHRAWPVPLGAPRQRMLPRLRARSTPDARLITTGRMLRLSNGNGPTSSSPHKKSSCTLRTGSAFALAPFLAGTLNAGCVPDGCTWRLSRAALWQPEWVFWLLVLGSPGMVQLQALAPRAEPRAR